MISVTDLRKGVACELDGELYRVLEYSHHKPGRGSAVIRTKMRNLRTGAIIDRNFISGDRVQDVRLEEREVQYMYHDDRFYHFMDTETYEQPILSAEVLGEAIDYLTDGLVLEILTYEGEALDINLPTTVDLEVAETPPGFKGDTASGGGKPATLSTGLTVTVPFFVEPGDTVRVDTRTGEYVTRVLD